MEPLERCALWPMHHAVGRALPEPARHLLDAALDIALVLIAIGGDHPQDLEHRIGIVRIPAAGAEPDLAEDLAVMERSPGKAGRGRHEVKKAPIVPHRYEPVPEGLESAGIARPDGVLDRREARCLFESLAPRLRDFHEDRRQVRWLLGII